MMMCLLLTSLCGVVVADDIDRSDITVAKVTTTSDVFFGDPSLIASVNLLSETQSLSTNEPRWVTVTDTQIVTAVETLIVTATPTPTPTGPGNGVLYIPDLKLGSAPVVISGTTYVFPGYTALGTEITGPATALSMFISEPCDLATASSEPPVSYTDVISYLDTKTYIYVSALSGRVSYTTEEDHWPTCTETQSLSRSSSGSGSGSSSATWSSTIPSASTPITFGSSSTPMPANPSRSYITSSPSSTSDSSTSDSSTTSTKPSVPAVFSEKLPGYICEAFDPALTSLVCLKSEGNALLLPYNLLALALALIVFMY